MSEDKFSYRENKKIVGVIPNEELYANELPESVIAWFNICKEAKRREFAKQFVEMI